MSGTSLEDPAPWGGGTIGQALLQPTVIYVEPVRKLTELTTIKVRTCLPHLIVSPVL